MKEFTIGRNDAGQRLDRWLAKAVPLLPAPLAQKYIRIKRVKRNGRGARRDDRLVEGDRLQLYINDEFFADPAPENAYLSVWRPKLEILYEDSQIVLLNKRPGQVVHPDEEEQVNTLLTHLQAWLYQKGEWKPQEENSFAPALCNRIDRNTGGIVIAAKTAEALRIMNEKIRNREVDKDYLCVVHGTPSPREGKLEGWLFKDAVRHQVYVRSRPEPGARYAATAYRTLASRGGLSLVECSLLTGRTHQIRAQMAAAGWPLLGDGKYGREDRSLNRRGQALCSWRLTFSFRTDAGVLEHLRCRSFQVPQVDFAEELFPGVLESLQERTPPEGDCSGPGQGDLQHPERNCS